MSFNILLVLITSFLLIFALVLVIKENESFSILHENEIALTSIREKKNDTRFYSLEKSSTNYSNLTETDPKSSIKIRKFGCYRNETPLIFVHIGKTGGGFARIRIAAAAQNFTRDPERWFIPHKDNHFYPLDPLNSSSKAQFCNGLHNHHRPHHFPPSFEGNVICNATTPIGAAIACPKIYRNRMCLGCDDLYSEDCRTIYVGHNYFGSEFHWLPPKYLQKWWVQNYQNTSSFISFRIIKQALGHLLPKNKSWCPAVNKARPDSEHKLNRWFNSCGKVLAERFDTIFRDLWVLENSQHHPKIIDYSSLYASLPLHRVTIIREPFSWLVSKFFWHYNHRQYNCRNITEASSSWALEYTLEYLLYLCGDDCVLRHFNGQLSLLELEKQVQGNLLNSFSVVGLSHEMDTFFEMMDKRLVYMNTSLNQHIDPNLLDGIHTRSARKRLVNACKNAYFNVDFQKEFKLKLPQLDILDRMYQIGVQVNRFQMNELVECTGRNFTAQNL